MDEKTNDSEFAPGTPSVAATGGRAGTSPASRRLLWAVGALTIVIAALAVAWLLRAVSIEKAMFEVAKSAGPGLGGGASTPAAQTEPPLSGPALPPGPLVPPDGRTASETPAQPQQAEAGKVAGGDVVAPVPGAIPPHDPATMNRSVPAGERPAGFTPAPGTAPSAPAPIVPKPTATGPRAAPPAAQKRSHEDGIYRQRPGASSRGPEAREDSAARETFRRCPAMGEEGAILCRWHVCNGAAGKEAACRPYLERRR